MDGVAPSILFTELARLDGVCNKVVVDDKGLVVLCVFGLPYHRRGGGGWGGGHEHNAVSFSRRRLH